MTKHDIVYFVKDICVNEELRYSLRSVEKNFPHNKVWFAGGCPSGLKPDGHMLIVQGDRTKWKNVNKMLKQVCENDEISEDFWLFNDDFFIMKPIDDETPEYNGSLDSLIEYIEGIRDGSVTPYTKQLRNTVSELQKRGLGTLNYAIHVPMLVNRKKALKVFEEFPGCPMFRSLYGNYWKIGGKDVNDVKIWDLFEYPSEEAEMLSSNDATWAHGVIGRFVREKFPDRSRFE